MFGGIGPLDVTQEERRGEMNNPAKCLRTQTQNQSRKVHDFIHGLTPGGFLQVSSDRKVWRQICLTVVLLVSIVCTANAKEPFVITDAFNADPRCDASSEDCAFDVVNEKGDVKAILVKKCSPNISMPLSDLSSGKVPNTTRCNGVTHIYRGKIKLGDYIFDSDAKTPLTFKIDKDKGYTYVKGKGIITIRGGKKVSLP